MISQLFADLHGQYASELKFTLNQSFYQMLETIRSRGKKLAVEADKFQNLGELAGLAQLVYELEENDGQIGSDHLFNLIYECYDQLFRLAKSRELVVKFALLKNAKRNNSIGLCFLNGVIFKIKQALTTLKCFQEVEYFKNALEKVGLLYEDKVRRLKDLSLDYYEVKRQVLEYQFQVGRMQALSFVAQRYKDETSAVLDEVKARLKTTRARMEGTDLKLIRGYHRAVEAKKVQATYFSALG
jgi:hypothetical protein